jgi:hypothetical protein
LPRRLFTLKQLATALDARKRPVVKCRTKSHNECLKLRTIQIIQSECLIEEIQKMHRIGEAQSMPLLETPHQVRDQTLDSIPVESFSTSGDTLHRPLDASLCRNRFGRSRSVKLGGDTTWYDCRVELVRDCSKPINRQIPASPQIATGYFAASRYKGVPVPL